MARDWEKDAGGYIAGVGSLIYSPRLQGSNGTFLLSLRGPNVEAFSVSLERAAGSVDVQVLVRAPSLVDYETQTVMLVQVRGILGHHGERAMGCSSPNVAASSPVLRSWLLTRSAEAPR